MSLLEELPLCFSQGYQEAEQKFLDACADAGLDMEFYDHPLTGMMDEPLATWVAHAGPADAAKLLVMISGTHGLEGLAGSGCQLAWLRHASDDRPADTAVLLVHMINPWGCSWHRRQTEQNVDLNRSFLDRSALRQVNEPYREFHPVFVGTGASGPASEDPAIAAFFRGRDFARVAGGIMMGQHDHPDGLGFCGSEPSWSQHVLATILDRYAARAQHVAVIDLHTGLGPYGHGALYSLADSGSPELARARAWYGPSLAAVKDGDGSYPTQGELLNWISDHVPGECTGVVIEYGTFELERLIMLQIDDARIWREGAQATARAGVVRDQLLHFFYPASVDWCQSVAFRALQVVDIAMRGLHAADVKGPIGAAFARLNGA
jgi:hypothetical protein